MTLVAFFARLRDDLEDAFELMNKGCLILLCVLSQGCDCGSSRISEFRFGVPTVIVIDRMNDWKPRYMDLIGERNSILGRIRFQPFSLDGEIGRFS